MSTGPVRFVFPRSRGEISGGHLYNERLVAAMAREVELEALSIDELEPTLNAGAGGLFVVDSLDLEHAASLELRGAGRRCAIVVHHLQSLDDVGARAEALRQHESRLLATFDLAIATGAFAAHYLASLRVPLHRIVTIPPPPPPRENPSRPLSLPVRALVVANLIPRKGVLEFLRLLAERIREDDQLSLSVVGRNDLDVDYARQCRAIVAAGPLARVVTFRGEVPPTELPEYYREAHVFVSASRMETFGMALQEANAYGLPLLALEGGNAREHVAAGYGSSVSSPLQLVDALLGLVRRPDRLRSWLIQAAGLPRPGTYTWGDAARELVGAFERLERLP